MRAVRCLQGFLRIMERNSVELFQQNIWSKVAKIIKYILILFFLFPLLSIGQNDVKVTLCVVQAKTWRQIEGAKVVVHTIGLANAVLQTDTFSSSRFLTVPMLLNKKYKIEVYQKGFYKSDTLFVPAISGRSSKVRLGIILQPELCRKLQLSVKDGEAIVSSALVQVRKEKKRQPFVYQTVEKLTEICLRCGEKYILHVSADGYYTHESILYYSIEDCQDAHETLQLDVPLGTVYHRDFFDGDSISLPLLLFEGDGTQLSNSGEAELQRLITMLKTLPDVWVSILVHAECFENQRYNRKLAERRAKTIEYKMIHAGIESHRYLLIPRGRLENSFRCVKNQSFWVWRRKRS